jgi:hypothetical protein
VADAAAEGPRLEATLRTAGFEVSDRRVLEPSLEDVFIDRVAAAEAVRGEAEVAS